MAPRWVPVGLVILPFTLLWIPTSCAQALCSTLGKGLLATVLGSKSIQTRRRVVTKDAQCQTDANVEEVSRSVLEEEQDNSTEELLNSLNQERADAKHELAKAQADLEMANARNDLLESYCKAGESDLKNLTAYAAEIQPLLQRSIEKIKLLDPHDPDVAALENALENATRITELGQQNNWDLPTNPTPASAVAVDKVSSVQTAFPGAEGDLTTPVRSLSLPFARSPSMDGSSFT